MHVLFTIDGTAGDVHPFMGIGQALVARGHRVSLCANEVYQSLAVRYGFDFTPSGTREEFVARANNLALAEPGSTFATTWRLLEPQMRGLFKLYSGQVREDTVMVSWSLPTFIARLVQEKHGVPLITSNISPVSFFSAREFPAFPGMRGVGRLPYPARRALRWLFSRRVVDRMVAPGFNGFRAELGLPPAKDILTHWKYSPQQVLGLFPDWFGTPQSDWPPNVTLVGFPMFDQGDAPPDPGLDEFLASGPAPLVFAPSSEALERDIRPFFQSALQTLSETGYRGIFLTKAAQHIPALPANVIHRSFVSYKQLLPKAAALVHHGGIGSIAHALAAGIPQLVMPCVFDQFDNAERLHRIGGGVRLDQSRVAEMMPTVKALMQNAAIRDNCKSFQARMEPAAVVCAQAADVIERVARQHRGGASPAPMTS